MRNKTMQILALAGAVMASGCAMTVGTQINTNFVEEGYDVLVEYRTVRGVASGWDSSNDDMETWAVNREAYPVSLAFSQYGSVSGHWVLAANSQVQLYRYATQGGVFSLKVWSPGDPQCNEW